jgi:hypothetical protein
MQRELPRIATWFLTVFGCSPHNDAILGDLAASYRTGRSRTWYCGQTVIAILTGLLQEVNHSRLLAFRCIAAGSVLAVIYSELLRRLLLPHSIVASLQFAAPIVSILLIGACCASIHLGKAMAGFHRRYPRAFVVLYVISFCSVLYVRWIATLFTFELARASTNVIFGGFVNYLWVLAALAGSRLFELTDRTEMRTEAQ